MTALAIGDRITPPRSSKKDSPWEVKAMDTDANREPLTPRPAASQDEAQSRIAPPVTEARPGWGRLGIFILLLLNLLMIWQPINLLGDLQRLDTSDMGITIDALFLVLVGLL